MSTRALFVKCLLAALVPSLALAGDDRRPLDLVALDGSPVRIELDESQQAVIVHFWATWCPSCAEELADLDAVARGCDPAGTEVVAVNVGEDERTIRAFLERQPLAFRVLRDPEGALWRRVSVRGLPANLIRTQQADRTDVGPRTRTQWQAKLREAGCAPR